MAGEVRTFLNNSITSPSYSTNTILAIQNDLSRFCIFLHARLNRLPERADLSSECFAEFLANECQHGFRITTLKRRQASLRAFIRYLCQTYPDWKPPSPLKPAWSGISHLAANRPLQILSTEEIKILQNVLESSKSIHARRDSAVVALILEIPLPVKDLISLDLDDFHLDGKHLVVRRIQGRTVQLPLSQSLHPLQRYLIEGRPEFNPPPWEHALFISQGGSRLTRQALWQSLKRWGIIAGMVEPISPRRLRMASAQIMLRERCTLKQIQITMGHSSTRSTLALVKRLENALTPLGGDIHP